MTAPDPRDFAAMVGRITGHEELTDDVLSGRMTAPEVVPLLTGLVEGVIRTLFVPMVGGSVTEPFDPTANPTHADVTLLDGSHIRVTLEARS
jgi:hypothetical protein